jgi:DNA adenine methylase
VGGKRWLIPHLTPLWEPYSQCRLVEPFCGGLAVALNLQPTRALLNDSNPHLINFYRQIRRGLKARRPFLNDEELYYEYRERFNALIREGKAKSSEAAQLFYFLNRTGYNGLCRFNSQGFFNVPFGRYKTITYQRDFHSHRDVLKPWRLTCKDFQKIKIHSGDFIYADPPYDVPFVNYAREGFTWADQVRLAEWLAKQSVPVVVSNQATARIMELYQDHEFDIQLIDAPRRIACNGNRESVKEVLATKGF